MWATWFWGKSETKCKVSQIFNLKPNADPYFRKMLLILSAAFRPVNGILFAESFWEFMPDLCTTRCTVQQLDVPSSSASFPTFMRGRCVGLFISKQPGIAPLCPIIPSPSSCAWWHDWYPTNSASLSVPPDINFCGCCSLWKSAAAWR